MTILERLLSIFVVPERDRLRNLLVPELADLRQQLDQARRLAGEAQRRYREAERSHERTYKELVNASKECDELKQRLADATNRVALQGSELARAKADLDERHAPLLGPLAMERDQLRADRDRQLTVLAEMRESLRVFADSAAKERDALMSEVAKHRARAAELEAERAKANEPRPMITTIKGQAPRLEFAADGQPITYVTPQPEPASDNQGALRYDDFKPTRYL